MQTKVINAFQARRSLGELLDLAGYKGETFVIEKNGKRLAALVPVEVLDEMERRRVLFFKRVEEMQNNINLSEEEALAYVGDVVKEVRSQSKE